jgi:hypothetical protein
MQLDLMHSITRIILAKISVGAIHLYVDRCTDTVLQILEKDAVHCPDATSQKKIAR